MPIYILLSKLTSEGRSTIKTRPERIKEVNKEVEVFGAKVLEQFAVLGAHDFVNIVEAPSNEAITSFNRAWPKRNRGNNKSACSTHRHFHLHDKSCRERGKQKLHASHVNVIYCK